MQRGTLLLVLFASCQTVAPVRTSYRLELPPGDSGNELRPLLDRGIAAVQAWFTQPFAAEFTVAVFRDRRTFTASFPAEWGMASTECWMVASGVADTLRLLTPSVWRAEACEHDPADPVHVQQIVTHELVHVFHGQRNPTRDFTGLDGIGWFVEGVAVLVSGQLAAGHREAARQAVASGAVPTELESAWSGPHRYGISGTLVEYLESRVGRAGIRALLAATDEATILAAAGVAEGEFLAGWADFVRQS